jgi:hypothetical protein
MLARFRALIAIDPSPRPQEYPSAIRVLIYSNRTDDPASGKFFQAMMTSDDENPLHSGDHAIVTLAIADSNASAYLATGQEFSLWSPPTGHGTVSRRVYTTAGPS